MCSWNVWNEWFIFHHSFENHLCGHGEQLVNLCSRKVLHFDMFIEKHLNCLLWLFTHWCAASSCFFGFIFIFLNFIVSHLFHYITLTFQCKIFISSKILDKMKLIKQFKSHIDHFFWFKSDLRKEKCNMLHITEKIELFRTDINSCYCFFHTWYSPNLLTQRYTLILD